MTLRPLARSLGPLGRASSVMPWWLAGGISASAAIGVYQAKGAASQSASYTNLANPGTYDLTPGVAPTWATGTGWTFSGGATYLKTGIFPQLNGNWSMFVRLASNSTGISSGWTGCRITGTRYFLIEAARSFDNNVYYLADGTGLGVAPAVANGVLGIAGGNCYRNGSLDGTLTPSNDVTNTTIDIYLGGLNNQGSFVPAFGTWAGYSFVIVACAVYNAALASGQASALTTAMNAL